MNALDKVRGLSHPAPPPLDLEKRPHYKNLHGGHADNHQTLEEAEPKYHRLARLHRSKVSVFARAKVFLVALNRC